MKDENREVVALKKVLTVSLLICSLVMMTCVSGCKFPLKTHKHKHRTHTQSSQGGVKTQPRKIPKKIKADMTEDGEITANIISLGKEEGKVDFTMPDGETCEGKYTVGSWSEASSSFSESDYRDFCGKQTMNEGAECGRITAYGEKGTVIQGEYFPSDRNLTHGFGLLKDNHGNIYSMEL